MVPSSLAVMHGVACQAKRTDYGERKSQIGPLDLANSRFLLSQELGFEGRRCACPRSGGWNGHLRRQPTCLVMHTRTSMAPAATWRRNTAPTEQAHSANTGPRYHGGVDDRGSRSDVRDAVPVFRTTPQRIWTERYRSLRFPSWSGYPIPGSTRNAPELMPGAKVMVSDCGVPGR